MTKITEKTTAQLRRIVREAREANGPKIGRWPAAARDARGELIGRTGEAT